MNIIDEILKWTGIIVFVALLLMFAFKRRLPKITFDFGDKETFAVDLNAYYEKIPTVYSKNCAYDGPKPRGYIPNMPNWEKYSGQLP